jgi:hypothetical protein
MTVEADEGGTNLPGELPAIGRRHAHVQKDGVIFLSPQMLGGFDTGG